MKPYGGKTPRIRVTHLDSVALPIDTRETQPVDKNKGSSLRLLTRVTAAASSCSNFPGEKKLEQTAYRTIRTNQSTRRKPRHNTKRHRPGGDRSMEPGMHIIPRQQIREGTSANYLEPSNNLITDPSLPLAREINISSSNVDSSWKQQACRARTLFALWPWKRVPKSEGFIACPRDYCLSVRRHS